MKRTTRQKLSSELANARRLRIAKETVKVLSSDELSKAVSGCPTDSLTTQGLAPSIGC
jgi:hypothetical protein